MVVINNSVDILYDLFYKGKFVTTVNYWQQIDVREQISRLGCEGYSLFINQKFRHLFDEESNIENFEVTIDNGGGIDKPFPAYFHSEKYGYVVPYSENTVVARRIYNNNLNDIRNVQV